MTTTRQACYSRYRHHNKSAYRSGLEEKVSEYLSSRGINGHYEEYYIPYSVPASNHKYTPDFVLPNGIIIETKGVWDASDRQKHLLIREQYPTLDIRFVFTRSSTRLYKGSPTTYASFCDKHGILYADKLIPDAWLKESPKKDSYKDVLIAKKQQKKSNKIRK